MGSHKKTTAVIGGGTMGADIALILARAGCPTHLVETDADRRASLEGYLRSGLAEMGRPLQYRMVTLHQTLAAVPWAEVEIVIEAVPEKLEVKRAVFADLERLVQRTALLTSNSSSFPISDIAAGLSSRERMFGLHFFMPAHLVPLVEVVCSPASDPARAEELAAFMRAVGKVPVKVRRDLPGFLANRLQHALMREAFALIDAGVASPEDVDAAVRFGFGFRFLAAGPVLQKDHAGLDVHCTAAATIYPSLAANTEPARVLRERVATGRLGMKTGCGFYQWTPATMAAERARYDGVLRAGLKVLESELPPVDPE
jgi:3-hydroxybutyryl-CoA dehydrogenase